MNKHPLYPTSDLVPAYTFIGSTMNTDIYISGAGITIVFTNPIVSDPVRHTYWFDILFREQQMVLPEGMRNRIAAQAAMMGWYHA